MRARHSLPWCLIVEDVHHLQMGCTRCTRFTKEYSDHVRYMVSEKANMVINEDMVDLGRFWTSDDGVGNVL